MIGGPLLISGWNESPIWMIIFILCFYLTLIGGNAALVFIFSLAHKLDHRLVVGLNVLASLALLLIGLSQIYIGIQAILS
jgi:asparagine N-glycosylation enzyme membrane subunit Stt3